MFTAKSLLFSRARRFLSVLLTVAAISFWPPPGASGRAVPSVGEAGDSLAGRLLVAAESMGDPRFQNTVIYMVEHNADGALGLIVNRPFGTMPLARLFEHFELEAHGVAREIEVYYGGPVAPQRGFLLHSAEVVMEGSIVVGEGVAMTSEAEMLYKIARGEGPERSLFALGYSGWGPSQLESELARGDWFTIPFDPDLVFTPDPARSWKRAAARRSLDL
jgi:putative transcriptional regulator